MRDVDAGPAVFVVDDDPSASRERAGNLEATGFHVEIFCSAEAFLANCSEPEPAGCLVLELTLPGMDGLGLQQHLRQLDWSLPIVFTARSVSIAAAVQAMKAGALTVLEKPVHPDTLTQWILTAFSLDRRLRQVRQLRSRLDILSAEERDILRCVVAGKRSKEIADELGRTARSVDSYRMRILKKTGARNVADLVSMAAAAERGLKQPGERCTGDAVIERQVWDEHSRLGAVSDAIPG